MLFSWLFKWLRVRIPSSSDDATVESLSPFVAEALPAEVAARFAPGTAELAGLGFLDPARPCCGSPLAGFQRTGGGTARAD